MNTISLTSSELYANWSSLAPEIARHRGLFIALQDISSSQCDNLLRELFSDILKEQSQKYRIDTRKDQFVYSDEIKSIGLNHSLHPFAGNAWTNPPQYIIRHNSDAFWETVRLFLFKFKNVKCYDRALTNSINKSRNGQAEIGAHGAEYAIAMDQIVAKVGPHIGNDWCIHLCIRQGRIPDNTPLKSRHPNNFKIINYRKLPHDRFWSDMSDNLLFVSSIGICVNDDSSMLYGLSSHAQKYRTSLIGY